MRHEMALALCHIMRRFRQLRLSLLMINDNDDNDDDDNNGRLT